MNARVTPPAVTPASAPRALRVVSGRDREFLPAALEILETPPPPLPIAMIGTICLVALAALIWSYFGRLDVHATAPGKIEPAGYAKVIEPLDPGKIAAIHVEKAKPSRRETCSWSWIRRKPTPTRRAPRMRLTRAWLRS